MSDLSAQADLVGRADPISLYGKVTGVRGLALRVSLPGARVGEVVEIFPDRSLLAQVVGFDPEGVTLLPYGSVRGIGPGDPVFPTGRPFEIELGVKVLGHVLDGMGAPIDGAPADGEVRWAVDRPPPLASDRPPIEARFVTGVRAIDGLCTLGEGQRVGLFAGSGVGKSVLLAQIAAQADADIVVAALVGERGRELNALLRRLGDRSRTVVVCATSDQPALVRMQSAHVATAVAEYFRGRGNRVLLLMDSVTRYARAAREVGLAAGEPPARRGYPPSVFARLPYLLERAGRDREGSITAIYTVLVEGGDLDEPVADEVRSIVDGHIVLTRELAGRGRWPAVDPLVSLSRVMSNIADESHVAEARRLREHLAVYEAKRDLFLLGAYERGSDARFEDAQRRLSEIERFLVQEPETHSTFDETRRWLEQIVA